MEHMDILKRAWQITWKHKALWLFGFLLALIGGGGNSGGQGGMRYTFGPEDHLQPAWIVGLVVAIIVVVLVAIVVVAVLGTLSKAALVGMVDEAEETGQTTVRSGFRVGWSRFLRLIGIDLVVGVPFMLACVAAVVVALLPLFLLGARQAEWSILGVVGTIVLMLLLVALMIVVGTVVHVVVQLAYRQCVLQRRGVMDSLREGWRLARKNAKDVAVLWLVLFGVNLAVGLVVMFAFMLLLVIVAIPVVATYAISRAVVPAVLAAAVLGLPALFLCVLTGGVHEVFQSATWTLAYRELMQRELDAPEHA